MMTEQELMELFGLSGESLGRVRQQGRLFGRNHQLDMSRVDPREQMFEELMTQMLRQASTPETQWLDEEHTTIGKRPGMLSPSQEKMLQQYMALKQFKDQQKAQERQFQLQEKGIEAGVQEAALRWQTYGGRGGYTEPLKKAASWMNAELRELQSRRDALVRKYQYNSKSKKATEEATALDKQMRELQKIRLAIAAGDPAALEMLREYTDKFYAYGLGGGEPPPPDGGGDAGSEFAE